MSTMRGWVEPARRPSRGRISCGHGIRFLKSAWIHRMTNGSGMAVSDVRSHTVFVRV